MMDTIVVGGGLAGLTAAAHLHRAGKRVVVLERSSEPGGRARTDHEHGYAMNLGAHALYRAGAGYRVLKELGIEVGGHFVPGTGAYGILAGALHTLPSGPLSLMTTGLIGVAGKLELARLLSGIERARAKIGEEVDLAEWTAVHVADPAVRALVAALLRVTTYCADHSSLSARVGLAQLQAGLQGGVDYVDGGWGTIVASLARGLELRTGVRVARVDDGGVTLEDGTRMPARSVIIAVPPRAAAELFAGAPGDRLAEFAAAARPALAACLDVALSSLPRPKANFALGIDEPLYVSVHSRVARLAPEGGALIHAMKYLDPRVETDPDRDRREIEAALELLQPGWRSAIVHTRYLPRMTVMSATIPSTASAAPARPRAAIDELSNVFLAGDWIGPHLLADGAFDSGWTAAELALARLTLEARAA